MSHNVWFGNTFGSTKEDLADMVRQKVAQTSKVICYPITWTGQWQQMVEERNIINLKIKS